MARQSTVAKPTRQLCTSNAVIGLLSLPSPDLRDILLTYNKLGRDELFFFSDLSIYAGDHYVFTRKPERGELIGEAPIVGYVPYARRTKREHHCRCGAYQSCRLLAD